jgi:hypothetical protein
MKYQPILQLVFLVLLVWAGVQLVLKIAGWFILLLLVVIAGLCAAVSWMLRYDRARLVKAYRYRGCREFIDLICRATKLQPPIEGTGKDDSSQEQLLLNEESDFHLASQRLKAIIRGHDASIDQILNLLQSRILLRSRSQEKSEPRPLAIYLLLGSEGIGKRFLARKMARILYKKNAVLTLDMSEFADNDSASLLFGTESRAGVMFSSVRSKPYHTIILENIECTAPKVMQRLSQIFASGRSVDPSTKSPLSFEHCVFFLLCTKCCGALQTIQSKASGRRDWNRRAHELLALETPLEIAFLSFVDEAVLMRTPAPLEKAEVVFLLMQKECRRYNISLEHVDPEILATEVAAANEQCGFSVTPARVERLLRDPLVRAARDGSPTLSLRNNQITIIQSPEIS